MSYMGFNYFLTFFDDFSRKCWIHLLIAQKKKLLKNFIEFHKCINNIFYLNIRILKSDNGTEYINNNLTNYLNNNGIKFIHSSLVYSQQNSHTERQNQTTDNCSKVLLNSSKLPLEFLDLAVFCTCHLYNISPNSVVNYKIPNEVFFKKPVNIYNLKVFNCKIFFFNNLKSNKFETDS